MKIQRHIEYLRETIWRMEVERKTVDLLISKIRTILPMDPDSPTFKEEWDKNSGEVIEYAKKLGIPNRALDLLEFFMEITSTGW